MYPLQVILIGHDETWLPPVRRELLNESITIEAEYRSAEKATASLRLDHDALRLFVVLIEDAHHLAAIRQLNGAFPGRPVLALLQGDVSSASIVHAMREGATQVVMLPLDTADMHEALTSIALQFGHAAGHSRVIAVTGAHGGSGATTLAVNLAYEVAQHLQLDCLLVELSLNIGVIGDHLNVRPKHTLHDLLTMHDHPDVHAIHQAVHRYSELLGLLLGPSRVCEAPAAREGAMTRLIHGMRSLADVIVLDVPPTYDERHSEALEAADKIVLVAQQTVPSLHQAAENLNFGARAHAPHLVVNQFDARLEGLDAAQIAKVLGLTEFHTVARDYHTVNAALNAGQPLRMLAPRSRALADIDRLAGQLLDDPAAKPRKTAGMWQRMAHAIGMD